MGATTPQRSLRLRVFAGPNGSGKSTIIQAVRGTVIDGFPIDFGCYINADDIATELRKNGVSLKPYGVSIKAEAFCSFADGSGLLQPHFTRRELQSCFVISKNKIKCISRDYVEQLAQLIARYLRELMLEKGRRFSFETVFSHKSNLDIMRRAAEKGYKVYLYFVATESPEINKYRVKLRVVNGGHNVPEEKIEKRYFRSLSLLYKASQISYQAYFFDNSEDESPYRLVGHFKRVDGKRHWDESTEAAPKWFETYYLNKDSQI